jgi:putative DNA primase/helicase
MRRLLFIEYHLRYVDDVDAWKRREPQHAELFRQKDGDLPRRLREQAQGVLADLVRGCLEWQKAGGLKPPESIIAAAEAHRESEDHLARFVKQACHEVDRNQRVKLGDFHKSYMTWYSNEVSAKDRYQPSKIQVGKDLVTMGYRKETQSGQTWVYGIGLPEETGLMPY